MERQPPPTSPLPRLLGGSGLAVLGLAGDLAAGYLLFVGQLLGSLALHVVAVGVWALGIHLLSHRPAEATPTDARGGISAKTLSGWTISAGILGMFLFPGMGTLGISFAYLSSYLLRRRRIPHMTLGEELESMYMPALSLRAGALNEGSEVIPLVDVLREQGTEMRRAVVRTLGDQGDQGSVRILRRLLTDVSPDVRGDAAVVLTRLENDSSQDIVRALARAERDPQDALYRQELADRYAKFAESELLDQVSSQYYMNKACELYEEATQLHPRNMDLLVALARVYARLGRPREAMNALRFVLTQQPTHSAATVLLLETAFAEQEWSVLLAVAKDGRALNPDQTELLHWWAQIIPPDWKGAIYG
ncbi:MAG: HEAT repeat domain-containing protein [Ktedonobacterales bacterium]|nr:HEAT repeat domain-containing protein [Ktedonobacterales bacterium]